MTLMEIRSNIIEMFKEVYTYTENNEECVFTNDTGTLFTVHIMGEKSPWDFLVIDYHDTGEDGEAFYPKDYLSVEEMFKAMLAETKDDAE